MVFASDYIFTRKAISSTSYILAVCYYQLFVHTQLFVALCIVLAPHNINSESSIVVKKALNNRLVHQPNFKDALRRNKHEFSHSRYPSYQESPL